MESAENYLSTTEPAIQHMFMALEIYRQLTPRPSLREYKNDDGVIRLTQEQAKNYLSAEIDSMSLDIAKSTLCGAIAQVAYSGIWWLFPPIPALATHAYRWTAVISGGKEQTTA